jgi:hypothetical protein
LTKLWKNASSRGMRLHFTGVSLRLGTLRGEGIVNGM